MLPCPMPHGSPVNSASSRESAKGKTRAGRRQPAPFTTQSFFLPLGNPQSLHWARGPETTLPSLLCCWTAPRDQVWANEMGETVVVHYCPALPLASWATGQLGSLPETQRRTGELKWQNRHISQGGLTSRSGEKENDSATGFLRLCCNRAARSLILQSNAGGGLPADH